MKLQLEDIENDLEIIINKYNKLIKENNYLKNNIENEAKKLYELNKTNNNNNNDNNDDTFNIKNNNNKLINPKLLTINNYKEKINNNKNNNINFKSISFIEKRHKINILENECINNLKKENERLKKIIIKYECSNKNNMILNKYKNKINTNILKERNRNTNLNLNRKNNILMERKSRPISKQNSKDHSYIINYFKHKNNPHYNQNNNNLNINNKSEILFLMNKANNTIIPKKKITADTIINIDSINSTIIHFSPSVIFNKSRKNAYKQQFI